MLWKWSPGWVLFMFPLFLFLRSYVFPSSAHLFSSPPLLSLSAEDSECLFSSVCAILLTGERHLGPCSTSWLISNFYCFWQFYLRVYFIIFLFFMHRVYFLFTFGVLFVYFCWSHVGK